MNGVDTFPELIAALTRPTALLEVGLLVVCLGLAWAICAGLRPKDPPPDPDGVDLAQRTQGGIWFGRRGFDGALFPILALGLALLARVLMRDHIPVAVFKVAVPVLVSLALIRVTVRVLHAAFPSSAVVRALERTLSWGVWIAAVL